jgi:hypothetical protein
MRAPPPSPRSSTARTMSREFVLIGTEPHHGLLTFASKPRLVDEDRDHHNHCNDDEDHNADRNGDELEPPERPVVNSFDVGNDAWGEA